MRGFLTRSRPVVGTIILGILIIAALVSLTWANLRFVEQNPGGNDFLARWMGARYWVVEGVSPYDEQVSRASQQMIYGRPAIRERGEDIAHFVYPLTSMVFFAPFGVLEFDLARALWMTILELSMMFLAIVSMRLVDWPVSKIKLVVFIAFGLIWYHSARTIIIGQFAGLNALLITLALYSISRKQDFIAGAILSLTTAKPQMVFLLIPFILMWAFSNRRRDVLIGFIAGMTVLLGVTLLLLPSWPLQWLRQLVEYPSYTQRIGSPVSVIANTMPGLRQYISVFLYIGLTVYLLVEWALAWGKGQRWFLWTAMLTVVITNLIAYRTATTNYVMMLPALFLVFKALEERWRVGGKVIVWVLVVVLLAGLWALFLITVEANVEQAVMYIPLPIISLIGLWWVRWWTIRPPVAVYEVLASKLEL